MSEEEQTSQKSVVISSQMSPEDLQIFHSASVNTILREIQKKNGTIETLIAVFQKLDPEKYHHRERIVKYMLGTVNKEIQQHSKQYVDLLIREIEKLKPSNIAEVALHVIELLDNSQPERGDVLETFPRIMAFLTGTDGLQVYVGEKKQSFTGATFKTYAITRMCDIEWSKQLIPVYISLFNDMVLEEKELEVIVNKIFKKNTVLNQSDTGTFLHNLLQLSAKGHRDIILTKVVEYLNHLEDELASSADRLRQAEIDITLHIQDVVIQDQELAKDLFKCLKKSTYRLSPLKVTLMLLISPIPSLTVSVNRHLKTIIEKAYKDSLIVPLFLQEEVTMHAISFEKRFRPSEIVLKAIKKGGGRDHIHKGAVLLGTTLLDQKAIKQSPDEFIRTEEKSCQELGIEILENVFIQNESTRNDILDQTINHIITQHGPVERYAQFLSEIIESRSDLVVEHIEKFKELAEYLTFQKNEMSTRLLEGMYPLLERDRSGKFRDYLVIVLRKAMYSRELDSRLIAVNGFIQILKSKSSARSRGAPSSSSSVSGVGIDSFEYEILSFLRRCFTQQAEVRKCLYQGLHQVILAKPHLAESVLELMFDHLTEFVIDGEEQKMLEFKKCYDRDQSKLVEPLGYLLFYCVQIAVTAESIHSAGSSQYRCNLPSYKKLCDVLFEICSQFFSIRLGAPEYDLKKKDDYDAATTEGQEKQAYAGQLLGILMGLMEYAMLCTESEVTSQAEDMIKGVFPTYDKLKKRAIKGSLAGGAKKGKVRFDPWKHTPMCSVEFVAHALKKIANEDAAELRSLIGPFVFELCQRQLALPQTKESLKTLAQGLNEFILFSIKSDESEHIEEEQDDDGKKKKTPAKKKRTSLLACERLNECIRLMNTNVASVNKFTKLLYEAATIRLVANDEEEETLSQITERGLTPTQRIDEMMGLYKNSVDSMIDKHMYDEAVVFVSIMTKLTHMCSTEVIRASVRGWVQDKCRLGYKHNELVRELVGLFCALNARLGDIDMIKEMTGDITHECGTIEEVKHKGFTYEIVLHHGPPSCEAALKCLDNIIAFLENEWERFVRLRAESLKSGLNDEEELGEIKVNLEKSIIDHLEALVDVFFVLTNANVKSPNLERLVTALIRLYALLNTVSKTIAMTTSKKATSVPSAFKTLCESVGTRLTENTYKLINHINKQEDEMEDETKKDKKGTKAKIGRELKLIPDLIFNIEQFELCLIKVSKDIGFNLVKNFKRSSIRAFSVKVNQLANPEDAPAEETEKPKKRSPAAKKTTKKSTTPPKKESASSKKTNKRKKEIEEKMQEDEGDDGEPKKKKRKSK